MKRFVFCLTILMNEILLPKVTLYSKEHGVSVQKHRYNDMSFEHRTRRENGVVYDTFFVNGKKTDQVTYDHELNMAREAYKQLARSGTSYASRALDMSNQALSLSVVSKKVKQFLDAIGDRLSVVTQDFLQPHLVFSHGAIHNQARLNNVKKSYNDWKKNHNDYVLQKNSSALHKLWQHLQSMYHELDEIYDATIHNIIVNSNDHALIAKIQEILD